MGLLNMCVGHSEPKSSSVCFNEGIAYFKGYFLWHIEIVPRLTTPGGFEMGSGMAINAVMPEEASAFLRRVETK